MSMSFSSKSLWRSWPGLSNRNVTESPVSSACNHLVQQGLQYPSHTCCNSCTLPADADTMHCCEPQCDAIALCRRTTDEVLTFKVIMSSLPAHFRHLDMFPRFMPANICPQSCHKSLQMQGLERTTTSNLAAPLTDTHPC